MMNSKTFCAGVIATACIVFSGSHATADAGDAAQKESISVFGEGNLSVPSEFKRVQPKSRIIPHEFQAAKGEATARVYMMAAGGGVEANIKRWEQQFAGGDADAQKTENMKLGKWDVYIVDVNGTYAEKMGGGPFAGGKVVNRQGYAMAGAILVLPDSRKYFVKMIGPEEVVKANRKAFVAMIKSIEQ